MALFDFMQAPASGQYAQGPMPQTGSAGVGQGITWAQLLQAIASMSNDPGAKQAVGLANNISMQGQTPVYNINQPLQKPEEKKQTSASEFGAVMNILGFGV